MVLIIGDQFRLLRWDHPEIVVTTPGDYVSDPNVLHDALQRLSVLEYFTLGLLLCEPDSPRMGIAA